MSEFRSNFVILWGTGRVILTPGRSIGLMSKVIQGQGQILDHPSHKCSGKEQYINRFLSLSFVYNVEKHLLNCSIIYFYTACAAGYTGDGTTCTACAADTFLSPWVSGKACDACATGYTTATATAQTACTCEWCIQTIRFSVNFEVTVI